MIRYAIFGAVIVLAFVVLAFANNLFSFETKIETEGEVAENLENPLDLVHQREFWSGRIAKAGAKRAYEEFKDALLPYAFGPQHAAAHIFGELLYESEGILGLTICDSTFSFGCYHSFFLVALAEQGKQIVLEMDKACIEKYGVGGVGCQHGIGHGLVEYLGPGRLGEALETCATLAWKGPLFGCQGGVFMEYTLPTVFDSESSFSSIKDIDKAHPYDVCPQLQDAFHQACYYSLGQWWEKFFPYEKMGELCAKVQDKKEREACYLGIGAVVAPSHNYNIAKAISACKKMTTFEGELVCRAGASWAFFALPEMRADSLLLCEGFESADSEHLCAKKSDLVGERNL